MPRFAQSSAGCHDHGRCSFPIYQNGFSSARRGGLPLPTPLIAVDTAKTSQDKLRHCTRLLLRTNLRGKERSIRNYVLSRVANAGEEGLYLRTLLNRTRSGLVYDRKGFSPFGRNRKATEREVPISAGTGITAGTPGQKR